MKFERSHLILLGTAVLIFAAVALFVLLPLHERIAENSEILYQSRVDEEVALQRQQNIVATKREFEQLERTTEQIDSFFVSESNVLSVIAQLERVANDNNVEQAINDLQAPSGEATTSALRLDTTGTLANILAYVSELEQMDTYISFRSLSFTHDTQTQTGVEPRIRIVIEATLFWL